MTRDELLAAVPVRDFKGRPFYVRLQDVPEPWRQPFERALMGSASPFIEGEPCAHVSDWRSWVKGTRYGGYNGPTGLTDQKENLLQQRVSSADD